MAFDLRIPVGILFLIYGCVLILYGSLGSDPRHVRYLGLRVDLEWGIILLIFGAVMLISRKRGAAARDE